MAETEIKVIETPVRELSNEERDVLYREFSEKLKIPFSYFQSLFEIEDESNAREFAERKPDIYTLLLRKLLDFQWILPIVKEIKNNMKTIEQVHQELKIVEQFRGSAERDLKHRSHPPESGNIISKIFKQKIKDQAKFRASVPTPVFGTDLQFTQIQTTEVQHVIPVQDLDKYINSHHKSDFVYLVDGTIDVCGFLINPKISNLKMFQPSIAAAIQSGNYDPRTLWNNIFVPYLNISENRIQQNLDANFHKVQNLSYIFLNTNSSENCIVKLFDYLVYLSHYDLGNWINLYFQDVLNEKIADNNSSILFKRLREKTSTPELEENIVAIKLAVSTKNSSKIRDYLLGIENKFIGKFSFVYPDSIWFDLSSQRSIIMLEKLIMIFGDVPKPQLDQYKTEIDEFLNKSHDKKLVKAYSQKFLGEIEKQTLQEMKYRWIFINKFGFVSFEQIIAMMPFKQLMEKYLIILVNKNKVY
jgi:hypothetical protein